MPKLIKHIDSIAREKGRDVLFLTFDLSAKSDVSLHDWQSNLAREKIIEWLDQNNIVWESCAEIANVNSMVPYLGQIYIDVPYDPSHSKYQRVQEFLENPDGTMKIEGANFCCLPLKIAQKNAAHDEPGFWDRRAEDL